MELYAHSARDDKPRQAYVDHVWNVVVLARCCLRKIAHYVHKLKSNWGLTTISNAAEYHDLGKLDDENQLVLSGKKKASRLPINHVDGGVACLEQMGEVLSELLVRSHHQGLPNFSTLANVGFRDMKIEDRINALLEHYIFLHRGALSKGGIIEQGKIGSGVCPPDDLKAMDIRLMFSCVVHADHLDTSIRKRAIDCLSSSPKLKAKQRLLQLRRYVDSLGSGHGETMRNKLRCEFFEASSCANQESSITYCDAPVGTGKTTAIMANLLTLADRKSLRRIFIILPFTNIITQSVFVYRRALVLEGENPSDVIAEIHHRADFDDSRSRELTALWNAPIIVTTAVAFFETFASAHPSTLRRIQQVPGSAIFLDEAHAMLPAKLLPLAWRWVCRSADDWSCYWLLASGSLSHFWTLREIGFDNRHVQSILPDSIRSALTAFEKRRVACQYVKNNQTLAELADFCGKLEGPIIVVLNTVHTAAAFAKIAEAIFGEGNVLHLSTALAPRDQEITLKYIRSRLEYRGHTRWCLVATSCVEAGVDLSFRNGVRESASLMSLLQLMGRVNRNSEYADSVVWTINLDPASENVTKNPSFEQASRILNDFLEKGMSIDMSLCTKAIEQEIRQGLSLSTDSQDNLLTNAEERFEFEEVESKFKVIPDNDTCLAVVDKTIIERINDNAEISWKDIQRGSVRVRQKLINKLGIQEAYRFPGIFIWDIEYSPCIGYMEAVLKHKMIDKNSYAIA